MENIQMVDMKKLYTDIQEIADKKVLEVLASGYYIGGPEVKAFEEKAAKYIGVKHAIGCANGTDALQIAMMALNIGPGDEVITTPFTFIATAETIKLLGATPVFVDVLPDTYNINPDLIEAAITPKTKAIIPVHLYGQAADMDKIMNIANKHNIPVIEDNAQGFGASYKGKKLGTFGLITCVSFYPAKNLGCAGDGGLMLTDDDNMNNLLRTIANHGQRERYKHSMIGVNSRLDAIQAALLNIKLDHLDNWNDARRKNAALYKAKLSEAKGCVLPIEGADNHHIYHQFSIQLPNRDALQLHLNNKKIPNAIHYPIPLHKQEAFQDSDLAKQTFSVSESVAAQIISLPMHPHLTIEEIDYITASILEFTGKK